MSVGGTLLTHHPNPCCTDRKLETWRRRGLAPCQGWAPGDSVTQWLQLGLASQLGHSLAVWPFVRQITAPGLPMSLFPHKLCWRRQVLN